MDFPSDVRHLWYTQEYELEKEVFEDLPPWMDATKSIDPVLHFELKIVVNNVLNSMTVREQTVLRMRFWQEMTFDECGHCLRVTKERIRQIEAKALRKLKHRSRSDNLLPYLTNH